MQERILTLATRWHNLPATENPRTNDQPCDGAQTRLSPLQQHIVRLLDDGSSDMQIAFTLCLSIRTVRMYRSRFGSSSAIR